MRASVVPSFRLSDRSQPFEFLVQISVQIWQYDFVDDILPRVPFQVVDMGLDHDDELVSLHKCPDADGVVNEELSLVKWNHIQVLVVVTKVTEEARTLGYYILLYQQVVKGVTSIARA